MDAYLQLSPADQLAACNEAGRRLSLLPGSIEKDFWVCWTLRELFALPGIGAHLTFKGGTSLSKCHGLIKRFSEDIDLVIDRTSFDIKPPDEAGIGSNERERRLESLKAASRHYIHAVLKPAVERFLQAKLPAGRAWSLIDQDSPDGSIELLFTYPTALGARAGLNPVVKIEPGARSDIEPNSSPEIQPYLAEVFPDVLGPSRFAVRTVAPERTFWEKAMLLHEANYGSKPPMPKPALARHYYDLFCLINSGIGKRAMENKPLFDAVHAHRLVFFRKAREIQDARKHGSFRLMPADTHRETWRVNYEQMREPYFFTDPPTFDEILKVVGEFEKQFNQQAKAS
jgi:predicted nucleotidyltransferase component of viral defense system